mmetsp:Transcript_181459/g.576016  ORF Transcript_181459/g.576016 Transcript_181459/m.576016 type:complete len:202 (-) Transcript_181459:394-999(-)
MTSNAEAARFFQSSRSCSCHPCEHQRHTQRRRTAAPKARGGEVDVLDVVIGRDPVRVLALLSVSLAVLVQDRFGLVHGILRPVLHALHGVAGPLPGSIHSTLGLIRIGVLATFGNSFTFCHASPVLFLRLSMLSRLRFLAASIASAARSTPSRNEPVRFCTPAFVLFHRASVRSRYSCTDCLLLLSASWIRSVAWSRASLV